MAPERSDKPPALELRDAVVRLGGAHVLDGFSLRLARGEKATLTGRSGSGKSTVLRCLLGFVRPEAGEIRIEDERLEAGSVWRLRRRLGYVAQEPALGDGTVREALERPFRYHANAALHGNLERAPELFERFHLPRKLMDKDAGDLSGGEKQRVALVSVLLLDRPILLLDEASSALDPESRDAVLACLRGREELTVLSVSHDPEGFAFPGRTIALGDGTEADA